MLDFLPCLFPLVCQQCEFERFLFCCQHVSVWIISIVLTHFSFYMLVFAHVRVCMKRVHQFMMNDQGHVYALKVRLQLKGRGNDCVKMALKEPGAQLARPISVRVAADDSQFSQPIIWALIYAQRGHSLPLTNQRPECPRLVTMANQSSVSIQSHRQFGKEHELCCS